jgi:hypothetical protein
VFSFIDSNSLNSVGLLLTPLFSPLLYLDPGSGSYIFQLIIAALVGGAFVIKMYWKKITSFFRKDSQKDEDKPE